MLIVPYLSKVSPLYSIFEPSPCINPSNNILDCLSDKLKAYSGKYLFNAPRLRTDKFLQTSLFLLYPKINLPSKV